MIRNILLATAVAMLCLLAPHTDASEKKITWAGCGISKSAFMNEMAAAYEKKTGIKVDLQGGGATKGIREVSAGEVDVGGTCRHVLINHKTLMNDPEERRVQLMPVAWDALVAIVHKDNPVSNLTLDQLRKIFKGQITNWKELGGRDAPIELYVRKGKISGVGRTLRELLFYNYDEEFVARHVMDSTGPLERAIPQDPNGVGVTGVSSARKLAGKVKILNLNGKEPSYDNIKTGQYLLYRPLYIVTPLDEKNQDVKDFVRFVTSEDGAQIMRKVGTVPYADAINLWLTYLEQQNRALAKRMSEDDEPAGHATARKVAHKFH